MVIQILSDEDIPSSSTTSPINNAAVQDNEVRLGPMTRSRTKLIEQQVNSLLLDYDVSDCENFILPKSMHVCILRFIDNTNTNVGEEQHGMENVEEHMKDKSECMEDTIQNNYYKCSREEREEGVQGEGYEDGVQSNVAALSFGVLVIIGKDLRVHMAETKFGSVCNKRVGPNRVGIG